MKDKYILALDEGTTSARAILFDKNLTPVCITSREISETYPYPSWVQQNAVEIYANQYSAITECIAKSGISVKDIACVGITNQRETTIVWDRQTGEPVYDAIVWQCRRTADICKRIESQGYGDYILDATGLKIDAYFSASKIAWILDNVQGARERAEKGELLFGTVDSYLLWKLSDKKLHVTDYTNASRTMLFNIKTGLWDDKLLEIFNIPRVMLPIVEPSSKVYGNVLIMGEEIPVSAIAGDQQSALFGQGCFNEGELKCTYGTGCFLLVNAGRKIPKSSHGLITTLSAVCENQPLEYALEGSVFVGGDVIKWVRDKLKLIESSSDSEAVSNSLVGNDGVYFVPAFSGLGAPHWDMDARGIITGITARTTREHIVRSALESIAYQVSDVIFAMQKDLNTKLSSLKVDGGASQNDFLMQFQSDISRLKVEKPSCHEATALGVAMLAGLAVGVFKSKEEIKEKLTIKKTFSPIMAEDKAHALILGWQNAVKKARS
ncbi:MAG: glycerol kinase GlpK [Clostridia bacterium]|nr:glycerol kinase GlpK [Clostridia bacterium]